MREVDWAEVWTSEENLIVDICRDEVEPDTDEWDDETGWLAALAPLRADVLSGDLRLFYLLWLAAIEEEGADHGESEPLPGIAPLSGALKAFAEFLRVDPDLVQAAAERTSEVDLAAVTAETMRDILAAIPEREKTDLLLRLVEADPHVASELKMRVRMLCAQPSADLRTVGDLRARWAVVRETRKRKETERREAARRRRKKEAEKARRARLDALKRQGTSVWREVELEIERRNASGYDRAAGLLFDLKAIAAEEGTLAGFARRLDGLHARHARKGKFIERLQGLMSH